MNSFYGCFNAIKVVDVKKSMNFFSSHKKSAKDLVKQLSISNLRCENSAFNPSQCTQRSKAK